MKNPMDKMLLRGQHTCPWWLAYTFDNPLRRWLHKPEVILGGLIRPGQTAVDIGCGMGYFTIPLARLVGPTGKVIAVDLQEQMLKRVKKRAERAGVSGRIELRLTDHETVGITEPADLILAFWMVHEVKDRCAFLREVRALLRPNGRFLVAEPLVHVSAADLQRTVDYARAAGLVLAGHPKIGWSRTALFRRDDDPAGA